MPAKTIHPIGDQSGGVNTFANERDADDRQYTLGYNVDSSVPGEIRCQGAWGQFEAASSEFGAITFTGNGEDDMSIGSDISAFTGDAGDTTYHIEVESVMSQLSSDEISFTAPATISIVANGIDFTSTLEIGDTIRVSGSPGGGGNNGVYTIGTVNALSLIVDEAGINTESAGNTIVLDKPDVFQWKKKVGHYGSYSSFTTGIDMSEDGFNDVAFDNGVKLLWEDAFQNFHEVGDYWVFTVHSGTPDTQPGYGLFPFQTDIDLDGAAVAGYYMAIAKPSASDFKINMYREPPGDLTSDVITIGTAHADAAAEFIWVDGALRIYDASLTVNDHSFFPQKWWIEESGNTYFKGAGDDDTSAITENSWQTTRQQLVSPTAGMVIHSTVSNFFGFPTGTYGDKEALVTGHGFDWADGNIANADSRVTLIIATDDSNNGLTTHDDEVGWGRDSTTSAEYYFYYSYLYENSQESLPFKYPQKITLGGAAETKYATFIPIVNPGGGASNTGDDFSWDKRITGIRVYYRRADEEGDVKYFIGEFPVTSLTSDGDDTASYLGANATNFLPALLGDESGSPEHNVATYKNIGILQPNPPTIFTHATMSGIRDSTTSIACKYKTATIVNRRLYVGNIKQKTEDSDGIEKKYPDRIIKSLPNKFDVLPDTEYIDVAIRDGEEVIKLESLGSRLLQFKQNTLYTIAVAGGEEYLDGTYKNMGVLHPNAVTKTEFGIFWVNERGAYLYTGEKAPVNLIDGKISLNEWSDWITKDAITGYYPKEKKFIVINNSANVWENPEVAGTVDMYIFNMLTQSWNQGVNIIGSGAGSLDAISNVVNYIDENQVIHTLFLVGEEDVYEFKGTEDIVTNSKATRVFNLTTKDIHAGAPHVRKKFYKAYITYKGLTTASGTAPSAPAVVPTVKAIITHASGKTTSTLSGTTSFAHPGQSVADDWRTAEYRIDTNIEADKIASRNTYSIQLVISGDNVYQNFKINDISLVFRPKSVK